MPGTLLIRADAGPAVGVGHVMRMFALGQAWIEAAGDVAFMGQLPDALARRLEHAGFTLLTRVGAAGSSDDAAGTASAAKEKRARWVVADGYVFSANWQQVVRSAAPLVIVDDNAENQPYVADCVLNVNAHAEEQLYARREPYTRLLLGAEHVLIRSEIRRAARLAREAPEVATRLLVTMGGADPLDVTGKLVSEINSRGARSFELELLVGVANPRIPQYEAIAREAAVSVTVTTDPPDVTEVMSRADLAFSAAGGTVWELGLLGVPAAIVVTADNQAMLAATVARRGAAMLIGDARTTSAGAWLGALLQLSRDAERRRQLVRSARCLVDGEGAQRVVRALNEGQT